MIVYLLSRSVEGEGLRGPSVLFGRDSIPTMQHGSPGLATTQQIRYLAPAPCYKPAIQTLVDPTQPYCGGAIDLSHVRAAQQRRSKRPQRRFRPALRRNGRSQSRSGRDFSQCLAVHINAGNGIGTDMSTYRSHTWSKSAETPAPASFSP